MERKCLWKNFILLTVSGLLALHLKLVHVQELVDQAPASPGATEIVLFTMN